METKQNKRRFDNPRNKKFRGDKKNKERNRKDKNNRKENPKGKKKPKKQQERRVYTPSFVVYEPFSCPREVESVFFAPKAITYRRSDGKLDTFQKGQLILNHPDGIISTLDGRYGKAV